MIVAIFFMCERKVSNVFDYFLVILFFDPLLPNGCKLSVLLTFSYVYEKSNFSCIKI